MKVCPRCSYVDAEGRRVCLACRRSLMGTPEVDLAEVLTQREHALAHDGTATVRAPWGPALTALVDRAIDELDVSATVPEGLPVPTRSSVDAPVFGPVADVVAQFAAASAPTAEQSDARRSAPPARPVSGVGAPPVDDVDAGSDDVGSDADADDIAEATRQQLARMYDARLGAPVLLDVETATNAPRPAPPAEPREKRPPSPMRRRAAIALVLVVVAFFGVRYVRDTVAGQDDAAAQDPTTPVANLPWRTVTAGSLTVSMPVGASSGAAGDAGAVRTYVLPDISMTLSVRDAVPGLSTDVALRSYATQVAGQLGGRLLSGVARDVTFGTAYSAQVDLGAGTTYLYLVSTGQDVVEVRADIADTSSGRATSIFERVIRSFEPR